MESIYSFTRYKVTPDTGYVAEVTYEGTPVFDAVIPVPSARLTKADETARSQSGRQISKRIDENGFENEFVAPVKVNQKVPAFYKA